MSIQKLEAEELRLRWTVELNFFPPLVSPHFEAPRREWSLWLFSGPCKGVYYLYLQSESGYCPPGSFDVTVHVLSDGTGRLAPELSETKRCTKNNEVKGANSRWRIWDNAEWDVQQWDPEFRRDDRIRFLVVIRQGEAPLTDSCPLCLSPPNVDPTASQRSLESLSNDFSKMLDQEDSQPELDVEFLCSGQSTKAHSLVVRARSPVIAAMLSSDTVAGRTRVIQIPDIEPDAFKNFLRYLYSGKVPELTLELALSLYECGEKYAVLGLARRCIQYLVEHLSVQNACKVLVVADAHGNAEFKRAVTKFMLVNRIPLVSDQWEDFSNGHPALAEEFLNKFYPLRRLLT